MMSYHIKELPEDPAEEFQMLKKDLFVFTSRNKVLCSCGFVGTTKDLVEETDYERDDFKICKSIYLVCPLCKTPQLFHLKQKSVIDRTRKRALK